MIILFNDKKDCCGCTACMHSCPVGAITMCPDDEGFKYPVIDSEKCINCMKCIQVCPLKSKKDSYSPSLPLKIYAAKHKNDSIRMTSTSGGAFSAISGYIFKKNGVVYGAAFDDKMRVIHVRSVNIQSNERLKGSKYVQSDLNDVFVNVKNDLANNREVLFTGTPCQIAGLRSFLGKEYANLILVDVVCHGTPSPLIWEEHVNFLKKKAELGIKNYYFRSKVLGWHKHTEMCVYENNKADYTLFGTQAFNLLFASDNIIRPACYVCKYANIKRTSDITIADFWGIEKCMQNFDDNKGVSLIIVNSQKGIDIFDEIKDEIEYRESNIQDCLQPQLQHPTFCPLGRDSFWKDYKKYGYKGIIKKYANINTVSYIKSLLKKTYIYKIYAKLFYGIGK